MTNRERLAKAAELLRDAARGLDIREAACASCSLVRAENWPERQAHQQLIGLANKVDRIAAFSELSQWLDRSDRP